VGVLEMVSHTHHMHMHMHTHNHFMALLDFVWDYRYPGEPAPER